MKKIFVLLTIIFLASFSMALIKPLLNTNEITEITPKESVEDTKIYSYSLCNGIDFPIYGDSGNFEGYRYGGDVLTEQAGICNVRNRHTVGTWMVPIDANLAILDMPEDVSRFPGLTYPDGMIGNITLPIWRIGRYVEADLNWNKPEDYCFTEKYTTRNITGQLLPLINYWGNVFDNSKLSVSIFKYLNGSWSQVDFDYIYLQVKNINKPLLGVGTDKQNYTVIENGTAKIKLTITDDDLLCGEPDWNVASSYKVNYKSAETFEIRINGTPIDSTDANSGAFGVKLIGSNQGELTITLNAEDFNLGAQDLNITVIDTDGYHQGSGSTVGEFAVDQYYNQIEKTVQLNVIQTSTSCTPQFDKTTLNWIFCSQI